MFHYLYLVPVQHPLYTAVCATATAIGIQYRISRASFTWIRSLPAEKIRFMLSAQVDNGGGLPLVKFDHNAGHENTPDDPEYVKETVTRPTVQTMRCAVPDHPQVCGRIRQQGILR